MRTNLHAATIGKKPPNELSTTNVVLVPSNSFKAQIHPAKAARLLGLFVLLFALAHILSVWFFLANPDSFAAKQLLRLFSLGNDSNIPTLFSTFILFAAGALLFIISKSVTKENGYGDKGRWMLLSVIFVFLGVDEGAMIHDNLNEGVRSNLSSDVPDFLYLTWVIPYFFLVVGVAIYFAKFLFRLKSKTRNLFILSGFLYVLGALGFELIESNFIVKTGMSMGAGAVKPLRFHGYELVEEVLEMGAIVLFIYALLDYLKAQGKSFYLNFSLYK